MADPGHHRLLCKPHPFRDCSEVQVGLLKIVEYGVAAHLILDLLEGRTFGAQTPVQCPWMQIECRGDPFVRAMIGSEELHDHTARLCVKRRPIAGKSRIDE